VNEPSSSAKTPIICQNSAACRRRGIDCFGERVKLNATGAEVVEHRYQVAQTAAKPVELPHNQRVAVFQPLFRQRRRAGRFVVAPDNLVIEDGLTSGVLKRRELDGRVLVVSRDAA
jgi:hypothetical protein